jgi:hypothetical protein
MHDFLSRKYSTLRGEVSSIAPTEWFTKKVCEHGITLSDFAATPMKSSENLSFGAAQKSQVLQASLTRKFDVVV